VAHISDPPWLSLDKADVSLHGNWLLGLLGDYSIALVSSAICFGPSSGNFTSFQGENEDTMCRTVIDYVACPKDAFNNIVAFTVRDRVKGYDHAATVLSIKLDFDVQSTLLASPGKKRKIDVVLLNETELEKLFIATLKAGKDEAKNF
jgi:hypothetical protein